ENVLANRPRLLDGRSHFLYRVLRGVQLVAGRHGAARGHDLDLVHVVTELLARGLPDLVGPVGDHADHADAAAHGLDPLRAAALVAVAAGLRQHAAGHQHSWPGEETRADRFAQAVVCSARVANRREALHERLLDAPEGLRHDEARRIVAMLLRGVAVDRADVDVGVGQPGHEGPPLEVERLHLALQRSDLARAEHVLDALALDDDGGAVGGLLASAIDQERVGQDGDRHRAPPYFG